MQKAVALFDTTIGKKAALAVSGLVLFGYVIGHMLGNLQVFLGPDVLNAYAASLKGNLALLWGVRFLVAVSLIVHVAMMILLYSRTTQARQEGYREQRLKRATYSSATMHFTGPMLLLYIVFHIAHFTAPGLSLGGEPFSHTDVYSNFVSSFSVPWVVAVYCTANLFLGLHLYHGAWSLCQSLGLSHPRYNRARNTIAHTIAWGVTIGNVAMPLCVLAGLLPDLA